MKNAPFFPHIATLLIIGLLFTGLPIASAQTPPPERVVFQVEGLTSAMRDGITRELHANGDLRLSFACVPAGILVFESVGPLARGSVKLRSLHLLSSRTNAAQVNELAMAPADAEAACARIRNQ